MRLFVIDYIKDGQWGAWEIPEYARDNPGQWISVHHPKFIMAGSVEVSTAVASWLLKLETEWEIIRSDGTVVVNKLLEKVPPNRIQDNDDDACVLN